MNIKMATMDRGIFVATLLLLGFGIVLVYSSSFAIAAQKYGASDFFLARQTLRAVLAVVFFIVFINVDYHVWGKIAPMLFVIAIVLLCAVLVLPGSHAVKGARRWISLGFMSFQASEFARIALVIVLAAKLDSLKDSIDTWKTTSQQLIKIGVVSGLILIEPNLSTTIIVASIGLAILFVAGARIIHIGSLFLAVIPLAIIAILTTPYRLRRLIAFMHKPEHQDGVGYQAYQAIIGLGNGGLFGRGLGQGEQKYFYLPEPHTDFVFSILGEEIGFIGLVVVLGIFTFILYRGIRIALNAPDLMGRLMAFGFTFMLFLYVLLHVSVNVGLVPTTGVPLPLLSYGGMSLVFTMVSLGILLNISSQCTASPQVKKGVGRFVSKQVGGVVTL